MCDFMKKNKQKKQKKETWNLIVMGSQSELYNMPLSKKSRSLKEKKRKKKYTDTLTSSFMVNLVISQTKKL